MIRLICIGRTQDENILLAVAKFGTRIQHYARYEMICIQDVKNTKNMDRRARKTAEARLFSAYMQPNCLHILLDEGGKQFSSEDFAMKLESWLATGPKDIHFYIGGPYGFDEQLKQKASTLLSLSAMTFNHELVRLVFAEQLYRAFTIINKEPYHHG